MVSMQFALLGVDDDSLRLAELLVARGGRCVAVCDVPGKHRQTVRRIAPGIRDTEAWEPLVAAVLMQPALVIAAAENPSGKSRAEPLRRLVQNSVPLVVEHGACETIVALELQMIASDTQSTLVAWNPGQWHPALKELQRAVDLGQLGPLQQVSCERTLVGPAISAAEVQRQLARDALLIDPILGEVSQVSAVGNLNQASASTHLTVMLAGEDAVHAQWSAKQVPGVASRLEVIGERGRAVLHMPEESPWRLQLPGQPDKVFNDSFATGEGGVVLAQIDVSLGRDPGKISPDWSDACQSLEIADCALESLERGKTIPVNHEPPSEQKTFKGMMAIGGCGFLIATILVLVVAAAADGLGLRFKRWSVGIWLMGGIFALAIAFLLVQFIAFLFRPRESKPPESNLSQFDRSSSRYR